MINRRKSPLYFYLKTQIDVYGKFNLGLKNLQKVQAMIDNLLTFCCLPQEPPRSSNMFVVTSYDLIKTMGEKGDIKKLEAVKTYLDNVITCCN